ncbi:PepSY domain-containing protein [Maricurvus nonylphenolicus]
MAVTGSILVFYSELDRVLNPDLYAVEQQQESLPSKAWINTVESTYPDMFISFLDLPKTSEDPVRLILNPRPGESVDCALSLYIDPYTAKILGQRCLGKLQFDRRYLMIIIYELHIDLLLGKPMLIFLGLISLLWVIDHFVSLFISFNRLSKWAQSFRIRFSATGHKRTFDLHRAGGLWFFPVTLMLALSGVYFNWYEPANRFINFFSPMTPRYIFTLPKLQQPTVDTPVTMAEALSYASETTGVEVDMVKFIPHKGVYEMRAYDVRDIDPYGRRMLVLDASTSEMLSDRHITEGGAGNQVAAWQYPLHSGKAFGWPGRIIIFLSGLLVSLLVVTGVKIWWRKAQAQKTKKKEALDSSSTDLSQASFDNAGS